MNPRLRFATIVIGLCLGSSISFAQALTPSPASLAFGSACILNTNASVQSFTLSGNLLTGSDITLTAPSGVLISYAQYSGYSSVLTLTGYTFPTMPATTVFVTFASASTTSYSDTIRISGGGVTEAKVAVTGTGSATALGGTATSWFRPTSSGNISTMTWEKTTDGGATWASSSAPVLNTDSVFIPGNDSLGIDQTSTVGYFKLWLSTGKFTQVGSGAFDSLSTVEYTTTGPTKMINISYGNLVYNNSSNDGWANDATGMYGARIKNNLTITGTVKAKGCIAAGSGGTYVHKVGGDVLIPGTGNPALSGTDGGTNVNVTWDIGGSLNISGASCRVLGFASSGTGVVNFRIGKDLIISNGQFSYASSGTGLGIDSVHIKGNVSLTGGLGIIKQAGTPSLINPWVFDFCGTTEQVITNTSTALVFNKSEGVKIFWNINNPAGVRFMNDFVNYVALQLIQGTVTLDGASIFSYTIPPASSYAESKLIYAGSSTQTAGAEYPAVNGPNGIEINNAAGVTLSAPRTISGNTIVTLTNGVFNNGSNLTFSGGTIVRTGGSFAQAPTFGSTTNITYLTPSPAAQTTTGVEVPDTVNNLVINNSSGVALSKAIPVKGSLTLTSGNLITTGVNLLTLGSVATISGGSASSFVDGPLANTWATVTTSKTYPVGSGTVYRPVQVTLTTPASPVLQMQLINSDAGGDKGTLDSISNKRYIQSSLLSGSATSGGTVKLSYGSDDGVQTPANLVVAQSMISDGVYSSIGMSAFDASSVTSASYNPASGDYLLLGSTGGNSLPVEIVSFNSNAKGYNAELQWKTATETDNYGFEIERRVIPNGTWSKIGFVAGAGNSNSELTYSYADKELAIGKYAYRLKQIDNSGAYKFSATSEIEILGMPTELKLFGNYPNPFNPKTRIKFTVPENGLARLRIYNIIGQEVANVFDGQAKAGILYEPEFNAAQLSSGLYFSVLDFGNKRLTGKMVLAK